MKFILHILTSPHLCVAQNAIRFARAALKQQHQITGVFFSGEAVQVACMNESLPEDYPTAKNWLALAVEYEIPLWLCVTASVRRGIEEPVREGFILSGLGQLMTATAESDRLLTFL